MEAGPAVCFEDAGPSSGHWPGAGPEKVSSQNPGEKDCYLLKAACMLLNHNLDTVIIPVTFLHMITLGGKNF